MTINLENYINDVENFPKPGILFKDVSPLLYSPPALSYSISETEKVWENKFNVVVALDARGFIFGSILSFKRQIPLVMVRKTGKLPGDTYDLAYSLEYGEASLSIQKNAFQENSQALVIDDLLATGGTARAACLLTEKAGAKVVGCTFIIELEGLGGREMLKPWSVHSLVKYSENK